MVVAGSTIIGISSLTNKIVNKLLPSNDGSNFGEEMLNDSTIEHEEKTNRLATFFFYFENGSTTLIIIIIGGIVTLLLAMGCCIFFCGCSGFDFQFCCKKQNTTRGTEFYREQWYAHQRQVNNPPQIIEMRSTQDLTSTEHDDIYEFYKKQFYAKNT